MHNPHARLVQRDPAKPTLRERAASLKASAARVIRRPKPVEAAPVVDWNSPPEGFVAYPHDEPEGFLRIDLALASETKRLHALALAEFERRSSAWDDYDASMKAGQLDKLRRRLRLDELARAADPAKVIPTEFEPRDGTIVYEDVSGRARRAPVADWISFVALHMFGVARQESGRLFNERAGTDQEANRPIEDRIRRDLRLDALHDLAFRSNAVFEAGKEYSLGRGAVVVHSNDDAEILALARQFDEAHAAWLVAVEAGREPSEQYERIIREACASGGPTLADHRRAGEVPGHAETSEAEEEAFGVATNIGMAIGRSRPRTLLGLAAMARATIPNIWPQGNYEADASLGSEEDVSEEAARRLIDACLSLAGVDWKGMPAGAFLMPCSEAEPAPGSALVGEMLDAQGEWAKTCTDGSNPDDEAGWQRNTDIRDGLIDRAANLPATRENAAAKAIAQCWLEYVSLWERNRPRDSYGIDGRLCFDIHDAVQNPVAGDAPQPADALPLPDVAAIALPELRALHDVADLLHELCHALRCQPRCHDDGMGDTPAGTFAAGILDQCVRMMEACEREAGQRKPASSREEDERLCIIAPAVIENGDPAQTAAFARDLQAVVA